MMWPVTDAFLTAIRGDHKAVTECQVWFNGEQTGVVLPTAGSVSVDRGRDTRRNLTLTCGDPDGVLVPTNPTSLLAPYGQQIRVFRGVDYGTSTELVPLGVFRIVKTRADSGDGVSIAVDGEDLSRVVRRNRWVDPYKVDAVDAADAVADILTDRFSNVELDLETTGYTVGVGFLEAGAESDPWRDAQDIARSAGYELAFGPDGVARLYQAASPDGQPIITYQSGSVILTASREVDTDETYNGVIASGEASSLASPVSAEAWDEDPTSPTYRYGPFGEVPRFYVSPFITTVDQADSAADSMLQQVIGGVENVDWSQIVNPAHDVDDVIDLTVDQLSLEARIVLDTLDIPLLATDTMSATARVRRFQ